MGLPDETGAPNPLATVLAANTALQTGAPAPAPGAAPNPFQAPVPEVAMGLPDYLSNASAYFPPPSEDASVLSPAALPAPADGTAAPVALAASQELPAASEHQAVIYNTQGLNLAQEQDGLLWKVACKTGTLALSPGPGQTDLESPLVLDDALFDDMLLSFTEQAFPYVTVPETHGNGSLENTGYVRQAEVATKAELLADSRLPEKHRSIIEADPDDTRYLLAGIEFTEPDVRDKAARGSIPDTSIGVKFNYRNKRTGKLYKAAWEHLALTPMPWVDGLVPFGLSQEGGVVDAEQATVPYAGVFVDANLSVYTPVDGHQSALQEVQDSQTAASTDQTQTEGRSVLPAVQSGSRGAVADRERGAISGAEGSSEAETSVRSDDGSVRRDAKSARKRVRNLRRSSTGNATDVSGSLSQDGADSRTPVSEMQQSSSVDREGRDSDDPSVSGLDSEAYDIALAQEREKYMPMELGIRARVTAGDNEYDWDLQNIDPEQIRKDTELVLSLTGEKVELPFGVCVQRYDEYYVVNDGYDKIAGIRTDTTEAVDLAMSTLRSRYDRERNNRAQDSPPVKLAVLPPWPGDETALGLAIHFDPQKHPRDWKGKFRDAIDSLGYGADKLVIDDTDLTVTKDTDENGEDILEVRHGSSSARTYRPDDSGNEVDIDELISDIESEIAPEEPSALVDQDKYEAELAKLQDVAIPDALRAKYPAGFTDQQIREDIAERRAMGESDEDDQFYGLAQNAPSKRTRRLSASAKSDSLRRDLPASRRETGDRKSMPKTVEELLAAQQAELEASQRRLRDLESQLSLAQGTISAQGDQLHTENVTKRVKQLQADGHTPALCLAVQNVLLADKSRNGGGLELSISTGEGDAVTETKLSSPTEIVEYLLSALPVATGEEAARMAAVHEGVGQLHASIHDDKNSEEARLKAVEDLEKKRHPERFDADGNRK